MPTSRQTRRRPPPADHPLDLLRQAIAKHIAGVLRRHYGDEGDATIAAVRKAIATAGDGEDKPAPLIEACAEAGQQTLLERRGERDLGLVTRVGMEARRAAAEWSTAR